MYDITKFKLSCVELNQVHAKFNVFDPHGANCGVITLSFNDVLTFVKLNWNGNIDWNGHWEGLAT